jgi:GGDEF domain-containing protein
MLGLVTFVTAATATAQASTPQWTTYGLGSLYLVPIILSAISSGLYAAIGMGVVATATSILLVGGAASFDTETLMLGLVFRGVGYVGVGVLVAVYARSLHRLAYQDILTGLPNRRAFFDRTAEWRLEHPTLTVVACDVDGLKVINDRDGHAAGDDAIRRVAQDLGAVLGPGAFIARVGGDEFLALVQTPPGDQLSILGASLGVATHAGGCPDFDHIIARADADLYRAKQRRREPFAVEKSEAA